MESNLQIFKYNNNDVRTVQIDGEPWWVLKDVCDVLEIGNSRDVSARLDVDEKAAVDLTDTSSNGTTQRRRVTLINESGLYNVIVRSDKPEANAFRRWVTHEVLPSIRNHHNATDHDTTDNAENLDIPKEIPDNNNMQIFNYNNNEVRTIQIDGEPWWVLRDVCDVLELKDTNKVAERLCDDELTRIKFVSGGQTREMYAVNESGLYAAIIRSDKPEAQEFRRWITHEVLPSIRKHGAYMTDAKLEQVLSDPRSWIRLLTALDEERTAKERLQLEVEANAPKVIFADAVTDSDCLILIGELAKILKGNGIEIGQNRLFAQLREDGYLIKRKGLDYNMPTQMAMELGLFMIEERVLNQRGGLVVKTVRVTGKGQQYFVNRFLGERSLKAAL